MIDKQALCEKIRNLYPDIGSAALTSMLNTTRTSRPGWLI